MHSLRQKIGIVHYNILIMSGPVCVKFWGKHISSRGEPTRGGLLAWGFCEVLTILHSTTSPFYDMNACA